MSSLTVRLFIEVYECSPRQRTIFRRKLLRLGWSRIGSSGALFGMEMGGLKSERQALRRTTRHVHAAIQAAEILDFSADCFCSGQFKLAKAT